jgi:hypothetical protein
MEKSKDEMTEKSKDEVIKGLIAAYMELLNDFDNLVEQAERMLERANNALERIKKWD